MHFRGFQRLDEASLVIVYYAWMDDNIRFQMLKDSRQSFNNNNPYEPASGILSPHDILLRLNNSYICYRDFPNENVMPILIVILCGPIGCNVRMLISMEVD